MSRLYRTLCALCVPVFFIAGCAGQTSKNLWRNVTDPYYKYINTPAKLRFDNRDLCEPYQITLSQSVADVDYLLEQLSRAMDDSDRSPDEEWVNKMLADFPWLGGIAVTDGKGRIMARVPEYALKEFNLGPLMQEVPRQRPMDLRAYTMESPMGPEIYIAKPVYMQDELRALIVAHFDMRALLAVAGKPENFVMLSSKAILWPSIYDMQQTPLMRDDWDKLGAEDTDGMLKNNVGEFYWVSTYFANMRLFYALPASGQFTVKREQLDILRQAGSFTAVKNVN